MRNITYTSGKGLRKFDLNNEIIIGIPNKFHSSGWDYSLTAKGISGATRKAKNVSVNAAITNHKAADEFRRYCDRDISLKKPGTLNIDGWTQRCYVTEDTMKKTSGGAEKKKYTFVLLDGLWRKAKTMQFNMETSGTVSENGLDYPHDFMYDFSSSASSEEININNWDSVPIGLRIYGPTENPSVRIAGNKYQVNVKVPVNTYLVTDPIASPKRVYIKLETGEEVDVYPNAVRGDGVGGGNYIFEKLNPGHHQVTWDKSFKFDVIYYDEDSEPSWSY